jgi:polyisoprenyl-phosphate glycosyltransferase
MEVSIIVPVYNSSLMLKELIERMHITMNNLNFKNNFEVLLINDSSSDNSWKIIEGLIKKFTFIKGINLSENFGQHNAIMAGLNHCSGKYIITIDDDLQHPPEFFPDILKKLQDTDVCYTNYRNRKHVGWKKFVSNLNNIVSSFILNKPLKIYMSSFKGFREEIKIQIIKFKKPDVYIDGLIINSTKSIGMITVDHHPRKFGESNYDIKKLFILWSNMILNFSFLPLRSASIFGIIIKIIVKIFRKKNVKPQFKISKILTNA